MRIWEILKKENIGKEYLGNIFGSNERLKVDYDCNYNTYLTLKAVSENHPVQFPLDQIYLGCILEIEFEEI